MARYSMHEDTPEGDKYAPYQQSRSALRRRFGQRAIQSFGPEYNPRNTTGPSGPGAAWQPRGAFYDRMPTGASRAGISNGAPNPPKPAAPDDRQFFNFGMRMPGPEGGPMVSGTSFVSKYGWGGVRSAQDMALGSNAPYDYRSSSLVRAPAGPPPAKTASDYLSHAATFVNDYMAGTQAPEQPFSLFTPKTKWEEPLL